MPTTYNLRRGFVQRHWEACAPPPAASQQAAVLVPSHVTEPNQLVLYMVTAAIAYMYFPLADAWEIMPTPSVSTWSTGSSGCWSPNGPTGTASAGGASTITTVTTLVQSLAGYTIRITGGIGAGQERTIQSNTIGANSVVTVTQAWAVQPDATSTYVIRSGRFYVFGSGTVASGLFRVFDVATWAWSSLSVTNIPGGAITGGQLCAPAVTALAANTTADIFSASTIGAAAKSWTVDQWANSRVRIVSGAGAGQARTIASNTATTLTVTVAWGTTPDGSSVFVIEVNEDHIYLAINGAVTLLRYTISTDTWAVLSPGVARAANNTADQCLVHVDSDPDSVWSNESAIINGRRLYSFRCGATSTIDYYDIPLNQWVNAVTSAPTAETFTTGSTFVYANGYIYAQKDTTGRWFRFSPSGAFMQPWMSNVLAQGTALNARLCFATRYVDPVSLTALWWVYHLFQSSTLMFRAQETV